MHVSAFVSVSVPRAHDQDGTGRDRGQRPGPEVRKVVVWIHCSSGRGGRRGEKWGGVKGRERREREEKVVEREESCGESRQLWREQTRADSCGESRREQTVVQVHRLSMILESKICSKKTEQDIIAC